jgi:hypothetical protein
MSFRWYLFLKCFNVIRPFGGGRLGHCPDPKSKIMNRVHADTEHEKRSRVRMYETCRAILADWLALRRKEMNLSAPATKQNQ